MPIITVERRLCASEQIDCKLQEQQDSLKEQQVPHLNQWEETRQQRICRDFVESRLSKGASVEKWSRKVMLSVRLGSV